MSRMTRSVLALGLVLPLGCAEPAEIAGLEDPIINGDVVATDGFPTVGLMTAVAAASRQGSPAVRQPLGLCTGTLISPTAVLLAAHCVDPQILNQSLQQAGITISGQIEHKFTFENSINHFIETTAGGRRFVEKASLLPVARIDQMPINALGALQRPGKMDDIAILHLASPVKGRPVQRLATPAEGAALRQGSTHAVAGYGQTSNDPGDFNGDGMPDEAGASAGTLHSGMSKLNTVGPHEIIAGDRDPQQACRGDSGGPIFADMTQTVQIGVASRINAFPNPFGGPPRCEPGLLYTRVDAYLAWIQERVPDLGEPTEPCTADDPDPSCPGNGNQVPAPDAGTPPPPPPGPDAGTPPVPGEPDAGGGGGGGGGGNGGGGDDGDGDQSGGCSVGGAGGARGASAGTLLALLGGLAFAFRSRRRTRG